MERILHLVAIATTSSLLMAVPSQGAGKPSLYGPQVRIHLENIKKAKDAAAKNPACQQARTTIAAITNPACLASAERDRLALMNIKPWGIMVYRGCTRDENKAIQQRETCHLEDAIMAAARHLHPPRECPAAAQIASIGERCWESVANPHLNRHPHHPFDNCTPEDIAILLDDQTCRAPTR